MFAPFEYVPVWHANHNVTQDVITNMTSRLKDPDIARLFENTFPNTLGKLLH